MLRNNVIFRGEKAVLCLALWICTGLLWACYWTALKPTLWVTDGISKLATKVSETRANLIRG